MSSVKLMRQAPLIAAVSACLLASPAQAGLGDTPLIGGVFNSAAILKNQVVSSLSYSTTVARDATLFTIAGVSLDTYILTLPLDAKVKARVMKQITDPRYAIPLGYFLYQYYDRYAGIEPGDQFKAYISTVYDDQALKGFEHSLYHVGDKPTDEPEMRSKDQAHQEGIKIDRDFIATLVTLYDALVQVGEWQHVDQLPPQYQYLSGSAQDKALVAKIQPIVVGLLEKAASGMQDGDMKHALLAVMDDAKPANASKINNKAEAVTVSLIDFVRLNVLKGYRQFLYQQERTERLTDWLVDTLDNNPAQVVDFLRSQQQRRFAVQVTVDGLQQGLMQGLVDPSQPFIGEVYRRQVNAASMRSPLTDEQPAHQQQVHFMQILAEQPYHDPYYLPFFKRLYGSDHSNIVQVGISSTPTISVRNLPLIKTGAKVSGDGGTGIPNFHFVDRQADRAYYFYGNDALQLDKLVGERHVQTMFDRLDYLKTLNCNAQYDWNAHVTYDGLINLGVGEAQRDFGEKRCLRDLEARAKVEQSLHGVRATLIEQVSAYQDISQWAVYTRLSRKWALQQALADYAEQDMHGLPDYTLVYNPWPDHFAHFTGPFSDEVIMPTGELNRLDYWLGRMEKAYRDAGVYERTLWGMAGDHGLAPVYFALNPEKQIFTPLAKALGITIHLEKISSDEGEGPKLTNALNPPGYHQVDVVVASTAGGNFMLDFFNAKAGWQVQPVYQELTQWQPAESDMPVDVIAESVQRLGDTLDYLVVRESACNENQCAVRLIGERDGQRVDEIIRKQGDKLYYAGVNGKARLLDVQVLNPYLSSPSEQALNQYAKLVDQCLYAAKADDVASWCDAAQWRDLTRFSARPDSVNQLAALYEEDRAGTVNLFPRDGIGYNTKVPGRHAGESYLEKDAFLGFWGAPVGANHEPLLSEANGSLAPTLFEYLTGEPVVPGQDGWGFPSLLNRLDIHQP
ncbi:alkaline phosphatase family protein [Vibrio sp. Vf1514]|uniref:alkaline phosphatase family protein n=1 Tax=Vibrio sp. Vf1514 TaxID=3437381 RepID=UPI003F8939CA